MEIIGRLATEPLTRIAIKNRIQAFITPDLYRDLDDFIKDNPTFEDFKRRAKFNEAYSRALNWNSETLTEEEYQQILSELRAELEERMRIETERIRTATAKGKEVVTYKKTDGDVIPIDNSVGKIPIEDQMKDMQNKYSKFRDKKNNNTDEMVEFMQEEVKPVQSFQTVNDISVDTLTDEESKKADAAKAYQAKNGENVSVNLKDGIIMDNNGNILEMRQTEQGYAVASPEAMEAKAPQKTLTKTPFKQAGFSDAILLALLTGMFVGLVILNIYIRTI